MYIKGTLILSPFLFQSSFTWRESFFFTQLSILYVFYLFYMCLVHFVRLPSKLCEFSMCVCVSVYASYIIILTYVALCNAAAAVDVFVVAIFIYLVLVFVCVCANSFNVRTFWLLFMHIAESKTNAPNRMRIRKSYELTLPRVKQKKLNPTTISGVQEIHKNREGINACTKKKVVTGTKFADKIHKQIYFHLKSFIEKVYCRCITIVVAIKSSACFYSIVCPFNE